MESFPIRRVAIVGGTHGNELTGVHLVRPWIAQPSLLQRKGLEVQCLLANPEAVHLVRRYKDTDLNRCFSPQSLAEPATTYEAQRAQQINAALGPKGTPQSVDLVVDLHNSTSNMGICLIFSRRHPCLDSFLLQAAQREPLARLYYQPEATNASPYLPSVGKLELTVEVGPQPHGTLVADLYLRTRQLVMDLLDHLSQWLQAPSPAQGAVTYFEQYKDIDFPRDSQGELLAMVHPGLQGKDYCEVAPGTPLFLGFDGKEYCWKGPETVCPLFINEQAYYEKGIAMSLTRKRTENW